MKSFLLATLEYPPHKGGIATYLAHLVAQFPSGSVRVLAPEGPKGAGDPEMHAHDMHSDVTIYRRPLLARWLRPRWLAALYWTDWVVRRDKPEMLLVSHLLPMGTVALLLKRWRGLPYTVFVHGMDVALALEHPAKRARARRILEGASHVVANSSFTAQLALSAGAPKERLTVVRPCPNFPSHLTATPARVQEIREKYKFTGSRYTVLTFGRLVRRKGYAEAIEALALLRQLRRDITLVIAGDGPERPRLEELAAKCKVADHVVFTGRVPDEDVAGLFASCDLFVMAPRSDGPDVEGFGIVYLEAALMARPVIGSRTGGVPEAVLDGQTGILTDHGSPEEIAAAISRLMGDPTLAARLGRDGRHRAVTEFNWKYQAGPLVAALTGEKR